MLGVAVIQPEPPVPGDPEIGGLSSLSYLGDGVYYAISDGRGRDGPARYYVLHIEWADPSPDDIDPAGANPDRVTASISSWQELFDADGQPLAERTYDLEGMVALDSNLFVSSEGDLNTGAEPFVAVFGADRAMMEPLALPPGYVPNSERSSGIRNNLAFEGLAITPDTRYLFTSTESALLQDGPIATPDAGALTRILRFDRDHGVFDAQFVYPIDAVHARSPIPGGLEVNGVAELLALSEDHLLVLERSFVVNVAPQHSIKLFEVCLSGATDISGVASLVAADVEFVPASKRLIADLAELVPQLDNVEGMSFGPPLSSGEQTLIFVSDNNFAPERQETQILAFSIDPGAIRGCSIP